MRARWAEPRVSQDADHHARFNCSEQGGRTTPRRLSVNAKAHWLGAAASDVAIETKRNRLLPVQCSEKLGGVFTETFYRHCNAALRSLAA